MSAEQQFISLLNKHQNIIHKVCGIYMDTRTDKEDLFQEITLQAWKSFSTFRGDAQFSTWLYRVALNTAITFFRKEKRRPTVLHKDFLPEIFEENNDAVEREKLQLMYQSISALSKIDKALVMLYLDDYNYNDIGEVLGITANNVAVKLNRIKLKLKESTQKNNQF
jgi:RNA polymerase sigma-70 factor (ECF subfamily)